MRILARWAQFRCASRPRFLNTPEPRRLHLQTPENAFKKRLKNGELQIGLWLSIPSPITAEICGGAGYDWVVIDAEHGPHTVESTLSVLQAVDGRTNCHPI